MGHQTDKNGKVVERKLPKLKPLVKAIRVALFNARMKSREDSQNG